MRLSAIAGGSVWLGLMVYTQLGYGPLTLIELLFVLAPLVVVPLGLRLSWRMDNGQGALPFEESSSKLQFPAALVAIVSFFPATGILAAALASVWLLFCGFLAICGAYRLMKIRRPWLDNACVIISYLYLPIGGAWLVASRAGLTPMNFQEPFVLLTAIHFHYAGFAAPILARATNRELANFGIVARRCFVPLAIGILAGPGLMAIGFVTSPELKLAAACIIAVCETGMGLYFLAFVFGRESALKRVFLGFAAASVLFTMALVAAWAIGDYRRQPIVDLFHMERMHGVANAMGFVLCGLLGWSVGGEK